MLRGMGAICYGICGLLIGILAGVIIAGNCVGDPSFLKIKLIEIIQLCVTILIAIFFTYIIHSLVSRNIRKSDMVFDLLNTFQTQISGLFVLGERYMRDPKQEEQSAILSSIKAASVSLGVINDLRNENVWRKILHYDSVMRAFREFKAALTDSPFGEKDREYPLATIRRFESRYKTISAHVYQAKLRLFS